MIKNFRKFSSHVVAHGFKMMAKLFWIHVYFKSPDQQASTVGGTAMKSIISKMVA